LNSTIQPILFMFFTIFLDLSALFPFSTKTTQISSDKQHIYSSNFFLSSSSKYFSFLDFLDCLEKIFKSLITIILFSDINGKVSQALYIVSNSTLLPFNVINIKLSISLGIKVSFILCI